MRGGDSEKAGRLVDRILSATEWTGLDEARRDKNASHLYWGPEPPSQPSRRTVLSQLPRASTMEAESQRPKRREDVILALNEAVEGLNLAKTSGFAPAKAVFGSVTVLLTLIKVCFLLFCNNLPQVHTQLGLNGERTGSCRARVVLRRGLPSARPRDEGKETGRSRSVRV